jgi:hypothetical protein
MNPLESFSLRYLLKSYLSRANELKNRYLLPRYLKTRVK